MAQPKKIAHQQPIHVARVPSSLATSYGHTARKSTLGLSTTRGGKDGQGAPFSSGPRGQAQVRLYVINIYIYYKYIFIYDFICMYMCICMYTYIV